MVGIQGLGGVPEPKSERPAKARNERDDAAQVNGNNASGGPIKDDVLISSAAQAAAEVSRVTQLVQQDTDIRADKVNAARESIARGDYKDPDVVAKVAERLMKYLT
jgi:anti-sigma28 factor (negative regulator of flagellin synthesis)